jgi:hypothetical protein
MSTSEIIAALTRAGAEIPEVASAIAEHRTAITSEPFWARSLKPI